LYIQEYLFFLFDILVFLSSINYWRKPTKGIRRNMDISCVLTALLYHVYVAYSNKNWFEYFTLVTGALSTFPVGYLLQYKGYVDYAMVCHVILHILAVASNMALYLGIHK
jgi:accessory gene regulator protein AgrB